MSLFNYIYFHLLKSDPSLLVRILLYTFEYLLYAFLFFILVQAITFIKNILFAKKNIINKCKNRSFSISKINPFELGVEIVKNKEKYIDWEFTKIFLNSIVDGNKFIIVSGKARTGKTRTVCEVLKSFSDKNILKNIRKKNKYLKKLNRYLFIYPKREEIEKFSEIKKIPRSFLFKKLNYIVFLDDILDLKIQDYKISGFINFFLENSRDLILIMAHRIESSIEDSSKNIDLTRFIEDYKKEICIKNKKEGEKYVTPLIINVPRVDFEILKRINNEYRERRDENYLKINMDGTLQPIFYEESLSYSYFLKLRENQKKIMYSTKLISYSTVPIFSKKLLRDIYLSSIFKGDENEFNSDLHFILKNGLLYLYENKENFYQIDLGILISALRNYPDNGWFKKEHINKLIEICSINREHKRLFFIGNRLSYEKRYTEAENAYRKAIEICDDNKMYWCNYGVSLGNQNKNKKAEKAYRKALKIDKSCKGTLSNLAGCLAEQGKYKEAEEACRKALEIDENYIQALSNLGSCLHKKGKYNEAEGVYRKALEIDDSYAVVWSNLGSSLGEQSNIINAEEAYRKALKIDKHDDFTWYNLGFILNSQKRFREAEEAYKKALEINNTHKNYWYNLGNCLSLQGKHKEAEEAYRRVLDIDENFKDAWCNLGSCLSDQKKYKEAEVIYRKVLKFSNSDKRDLYNLGSVLSSQEKYIEAEKVFKKALKIDKGFREALVNISDCFLKLKKYKMAEKACKKALKIDKNCKVTLFNLGSCLSAQGKYNEAEEAYKRAIEIDENFNEAQQELLKCLNAQCKTNIRRINQ